MSGTKHIIGWEKNVPCSATITLGTPAATVAIQIQLLDYQGKALTAKAAIRAYYSTDADADTVEAVGAASVVATNGIVIEDLTTYSVTLISEDDGTVGLTINGDGAVTNYLNLIFPDGHIQTSGSYLFTS